MNDRELLEAAAKAAGFPKGIHRAGDGLLMANDLYWNPLTDDGDALRLAVKLGIRVHPTDDGETWVTHPEVTMLEDVIFELHNGDPYAATRRAIVRAAAEIERSKT
jgi:hypothetical protein